MIDLSPVEKQILAALTQIETALPPVLTTGGGDARDVTNAQFHLRGLRNMVLSAAAGRESAARPVLDPVERGSEVQAEGGHRVLVRSGKVPGDDRTWWVVNCTRSDYTARDLDQEIATRMAERHSGESAVGAR